MSALVCGLDVHKESTYATIIDQNGVIVTQRRMLNEEVPDFLRPLCVEKVAMEASTSIAPLYRKLVEEGYDVTVSHPRKTRYIAEARIKSDRVDSKVLVELLRLNSLPESYMPPPHIAVLREKVRRRAFLIRQRTKLKVKISRVLTYEDAKLPEGHGLYTRVRQLEGIKILEKNRLSAFRKRGTPTRALTDVIIGSSRLFNHFILFCFLSALTTVILSLMGELC